VSIYEYVPHGLHAAKVKPERCKASVHEPGRGIFIHQCQRKPTRDGWCNQHHPDTAAKRRVESQKRWDAKQERSPHRIIARLQGRIKEIEAELASRKETER